MAKFLVGGARAGALLSLFLCLDDGSFSRLEAVKPCRGRETLLAGIAGRRRSSGGEHKYRLYLLVLVQMYKGNRAAGGAAENNTKIQA